MSLAYTPDRLRLPDSLQAQLHEYRRRVWTIKMVEAVAAAAFGVLVAYLLLFCLDRVWDTPGWLRVGLFVAAAVACANIPWALHRWVWRHRRLEQLARLLARKHPRVGDQLLGIIELVRNDFEQARSPALCEAAIREVAHDARRRDFRDAVPNPRHRLWIWLVAVPMVTALVLVRPFPGRRRQCLAAVPLALEKRAPLHVHDARAVLARRSSSRTASRSRSRSSSRATRSGIPRQGVAQLGRSAPGRRPVARRPVRVRAAAADRSGLAGHQDRRRDRARAHRADPAPRADLGRRVGRAARLSRPARDRSGKTCAAARSRWCWAAWRRSPPPPAASCDRRRSTASRSSPPGRPSPARRRRSRARASSSSAGRTGSAWPARSRSCSRSPAAKTRRPRSPAKTCPARRSCSIPSS